MSLRNGGKSVVAMAVVILTLLALFASAERLEAQATVPYLKRGAFTKVVIGMSGPPEGFYTWIIYRYYDGEWRPWCADRTMPITGKRDWEVLFVERNDATEQIKINIFVPNNSDDAPN